MVELFILSPLTASTNHMCHIVVPMRDVFNLMHASPVAGHIGKYKIYYRLKIRFFWLGIKIDIKDWVKQCPRCMLTYK